MEVLLMYSWLIVLHVVSVLGFVAGHGVAAAIAFKVRGEREITRIRTQLGLFRSASVIGGVFLPVFLASGIITGYMGHWWDFGWIWASLGVLVVMGIAFYILGSSPLDRIRKMLRSDATTSTDKTLSPNTSTEQRVASILSATHPLLLMAIGGVGTALIFWLMMDKPF
jgi:hypothetical protein